MGQIKNIKLQIVTDIKKMSSDRKGGSDLLVIGAGLPRTGTLSLMTALEMLLPGECHHGMKMWQHSDELYDIVTSGCLEDGEKLNEFFRKHGYVSTADIPLCFHYESAMKTFPQAKVIQTVRDTPNKWYNSIKIVQNYRNMPLSLIEWFGYNLPSYLSQIGPRDDLRDSGPKLGSVFFANQSSNRNVHFDHER